MLLSVLLLVLLHVGAHLIAAAPTRRRHTCPTKASSPVTDAHPPQTGCFPALGFQMPENPPSGDIDTWWCDPKTEYAFLGFSYEISACQSPQQLDREFKDIRQNFHGRYVRLYGACDKHGYYDTIVDAAWNNGLGIHALVWFGFDGGDIWKKRRDALFSSLHSNPKAKFVTRVVQFGSEPLFDDVLSPSQLAHEVTLAKQELSSLNIPVTVSELASAYQNHKGSQAVLDAVDSINGHMLPFFATKATTGKQAWPLVEDTLNFFTKHGAGKKIYLDENGWPSVTSSGVSPNNDVAVASVQSEKDYFTMLDQHCEDFKGVPGGGVGWFAHIYSDEQEPGYGIYNSAGKKKFAFAPRTKC